MLADDKKQNYYQTKTPIYDIKHNCLKHKFTVKIC